MSFVCPNCWFVASYPLHFCKRCNSEVEFVKEEKEEKKIKDSQVKKPTVLVGEVLELKTNYVNKDLEFYPLQDKELNRVLVDGIAKWGIYLLTGNPWAWKSTLMAQIIWEVSNQWVKCAYFSWEENESQVFNRHKRLWVTSWDIYHTGKLEDIFATILAKNYKFIVIDSVQTTYSVTCEGKAWDIAQIKTIWEMLTQFLKTNNITAFIIGHVNKNWDIAWPKYLEHMVDAPLYLEGDKYQRYKFLRATKNRFCPNDDIWIFEMKQEWLIGVKDMKERVIKEFTRKPWNVLGIGIDDGRPIFVNVETLITPCAFNFPQRSVGGYDKERVNLLLAIMERYLHYQFKEFDIFINIPWEANFKKDIGLDLAIIASIYSAIQQKIFSEQVFFGEVTLMWKVKNASFQDKRKKEARWMEIVTIDENKNDITEMFNTNWKFHI